jgi:hypothetical protein
MVRRAGGPPRGRRTVPFSGACRLPVAGEKPTLFWRRRPGGAAHFLSMVSGQAVLFSSAPLFPYVKSSAHRLLLLLVALCGAPHGRAAEPVSFRTDVMAIVSKAGCNLGGCHGNATGKGGLKLSLRGQDPDLDWLALTREQSGRRVNFLEPEKSLLLLKATAAVAHEGGQRFAPQSAEYETVLRWLRDGAPDSGSDGPRLARLEVSPIERILVEPHGEVQLNAVATFADGTRRDITRLAVYEPNNDGVRVSPGGLVAREKLGETTVLVRYLDQQVAVHLAFVPARPGFVWQEPPAANFVDEHVFRKLRTLRMNPSALCSDEVFLRRAFLDLLGVIPTADEARAFLEDSAPGKRARLVERLLEREEFADFWALKWADLLKIEERQLDKEGMRVFHAWIRQSIRENKPLDQFARELIAARGSTFKNPPANWWRANRDPVTRAENTAQVFLGTRLNCAQCHNHPFERWTQDDYYDWTTLFARIDYKLSDAKRTDKNDKQEFRGDQTVFLKPAGVVMNPRTGQAAVARFLGGEAPRVEGGRDELVVLGEWLSRSPMFVRMQVNRVWLHLMGRGLVDPADDFRASNPPSHPGLLDELARDFAGNGYDLRRLIRTVMASRAYQLAAEPNDTNREDETNHSRAIVRRLTAEQLIDSVSAALAAPLPIEGFPSGTRLAQVPEGRKHYRPIKSDLDRFSTTFGKPPRLIASDCERSNDTALPQAFQLISGPLVQELLTRSGNRLDGVAAMQDLDLIDELFWSVLSRPPTTREIDRTGTHLANAADRRRALEDIAWALLNSKEFLFRR